MTSDIDNLNHIYFTHRRFDDDCLFSLLESPLRA